MTWTPFGFNNGSSGGGGSGGSGGSGGASDAADVSLAAISGFVDDSNSVISNVQVAVEELNENVNNANRNILAHLIEPEDAHDGSAIYFDGTGTNYMVPGTSSSDPKYQKNVKFALDALDAAIAGISAANVGNFRDEESLTLIHDNITGEDYYLTTYNIMSNCIPQLAIRGSLQGPSSMTVENYPVDSTRRKISLGTSSGVLISDPAYVWYRSSN